MLDLIRRGKLTDEGAFEQAGNASYTLTCPAGKKWVLLCGLLKLVADATVATRNWTVYVDKGAGTREKARFATNWNVTASQTRHLHIGHKTSEIVTNDGDCLLDMPVIMEAGDRIIVEQASGGQVGDKISYNFNILEVDT